MFTTSCRHVPHSTLLFPCIRVSSFCVRTMSIVAILRFPVPCGSCRKPCRKSAPSSWPSFWSSPFIANGQFLQHLKRVEVRHFELSADIWKQDAAFRIGTRLFIRHDCMPMSAGVCHKPSVRFSCKFGFGGCGILRVSLCPQHDL